jgi:hypothetical protein
MDIEGDPIFWADASLEKIETTHDDVALHLHEDTGAKKLLHCLGHVGFQMIGFWDELIIENATMPLEHSFIADCERRLEKLPASGTATRHRAGNRLLEVTFLDGCRLWVCAHRFHCVRVL